MNEEIFFIRLRDCFNAGYQMPQFCIDNEIKKPLFIALDGRHLDFIWEIYAQFVYSRKIEIQPQFSYINGITSKLDIATERLIEPMIIKNIGEISPNTFDAIIFLTTDSKLNLPLEGNKIISFEKLVETFETRAYTEIPVLNFIQKYPEIKLFMFTTPRLSKNKHNTEWEKKVLKGEYTPIWTLKAQIDSGKFGKINTPYDFLGYSNKYVSDCLHLPVPKVHLDGNTTISDYPYSPIMICNGRRVTVDQPDTYKNRIIFVGGCVQYGYGVPYQKTTESVLQQLLNANKLPYRVENESQFCTNRRQDVLYKLNSLSLKPNDIVFLTLPHFHTRYIPLIDFTNLFTRPHNYGEVFPDDCHPNELGHKGIAENLFLLLIKNNFFQNIKFKYPAPPPPPHRYGIPKENFYSNSNFIDNKDLEIYKEKLRDKRLQIGAIVMNCNPFTWGHMALIQYAASKVTKLYIFVVEEDKSEFSFADRFELVKRGTEEFPNVEVIPSGKFIISQQTFSGYFNKAELQDVAVDSSEDVEIFAREIAPTLGINIRFAGEEPEDTVTRQYNENMKNILPRYGIDFVEIPRMKINGEVISAKSVRAALEVGDFEKIAKLVPKTTLDFLIENYSTPPLPCGRMKYKFIGGILVWLILLSVTNAQTVARR